MVQTVDSAELWQCVDYHQELKQELKAGATLCTCHHAHVKQGTNRRASRCTICNVLSVNR